MQRDGGGPRPPRVRTVLPEAGPGCFQAARAPGLHQAPASTWAQPQGSEADLLCGGRAGLPVTQLFTQLSR